MTREIELPLLHCYRCGNTWTPRVRIVRICPRCKSPYWEEPKIRVPRGGGGLGATDVLGPYRSRIERIARRYGAREIRVFGSLARGSATAQSDVDLLVDFDRSRPTRSTLRSIDLAMHLKSLLGRDVDVVTEDSLPWFIQPQVIAEAVPL
jgi:predicted nucleotidyltransferase